jgi:electron transport complex protein RnfB
MPTVKDIDALLPQTQCGECDYSGCLPYAEALSQGTALINKCPPGGVVTIKALAALLNKDPTPYLQEAHTRQPALAVIREEECIGCTKCIKACPVDAIIGSGTVMHAVITHECTGCGLCVEPCPVDCIEMSALPEARYDTQVARQHHHAKQSRLLRDEHQQQQEYRAKRQLAKRTQGKDQEVKAKQDYIHQALARMNAKKLS